MKGKELERMTQQANDLKAQGFPVVKCICPDCKTIYLAYNLPITADDWLKWKATDKPLPRYCPKCDTSDETEDESED